MSAGARPLVILPTYNENENLASLVPQILARLHAHILIVDDRSPDGTGQTADRLAAGHAGVSVLHRPEKLGLGSAYVAGFRWALARDFDAIVQMDCDFSHDPGDICRLLAGLADADLVLGSRYVEGGAIENWPWFRLWVSGLGNAYARGVVGLPVRDLTGGFKAFKRETVAALDLGAILSDGYAFQIETTFRSLQKGFRVKEIPIVFKDRTRGRSKISRRVLFEALCIPWKLRFNPNFPFGRGHQDEKA